MAARACSAHTTGTVPCAVEKQCSLIDKLGYDKVTEDFVTCGGRLVVEARLPVGTAYGVCQFGLGSQNRLLKPRAVGTLVVGRFGRVLAFGVAGYDGLAQ